MEDIKRVISFDSVEEFWGCVLVVVSTRFHAMLTPSRVFDEKLFQAVQQHRTPRGFAPEGKLLSVQGQWCGMGLYSCVRDVDTDRGEARTRPRRGQNTSASLEVSGNDNSDVRLEEIDFHNVDVMPLHVFE